MTDTKNPSPQPRERVAKDTAGRTDVDRIAHLLTGSIAATCCHKTGGYNEDPNCECRELAREIIALGLLSPQPTSTLSPHIAHNCAIAGECSVSDNTEDGVVSAWNRRARAPQPNERRSTHHVHRGPESIPCFCAAASDHSIGQEQTHPSTPSLQQNTPPLSDTQEGGAK